MAYIPLTSQATLLTSVRRRRTLPGTINVLVKEGQRVASGDVVAEGEVAEAHQLIDLAAKLGVRANKLEPYILKHEGDFIKKGEAVARKRGMLGTWRSATAAADSRLVLLDGGKALLATVRPVELRAGLPGTIVGPLGGGVTIETTGAVVSGVWGNGQEGFSVLRMLTAEPATVLHAGLLEPSLRGAIVAGGSLSDDSLFSGLAEVGVGGLILGRLGTRSLAAAEKAPFPVMVAEGFGEGGFSQPVFALLNGNAGREVWLNACAWDRNGTERPEAIIPLPANNAPVPVPGEPLAEGKRVRILRGPEAGRVGHVTGLSDRPMLLPSGIRARLAVIALDDVPGQRPTVSAPFANLEILA